MVECYSAVCKGPNVSPHQPRFIRPKFSHFSALLFVVFCGLPETGSVIATGWRDDAEMSTNERGGLGEEEGRV